MNSADSSRVESLLDWGCQHGATLHDSVEVYKDDTTSYSLRIKPTAPPSSLPPLSDGQPIVTCPASVTLSYLNALLGGPLPTNANANLTQPSALTLLSPSFPPAFL